MVCVLSLDISIPEDMCAWDTKNGVRVWMARRIEDTETHREVFVKEEPLNRTRNAGVGLEITSWRKKKRLPW